VWQPGRRYPDGIPEGNGAVKVGPRASRFAPKEDT
jgi:hypothetical protein